MNSSPAAGSLANSLRHLRWLRQQIPTSALALLLLLMFGCSLTDGIGILMLVPLLSLLQDATAPASGIAGGLFRVFARIGLPPDAGSLLLVFVGLMLLRGGLQLQRELQSSQQQQELVDRLRQRCFAGLLHARWRWLSGRRLSDFSNLLISDINRVGQGLYFGFGLLATLSLMLAYLAVALVLSPQLTLLALGSGGALLLGMRRQRWKSVVFGRSVSDANARFHGLVSDSLQGLRIARILGAEQRYLDDLAGSMGQIRKQQYQFMQTSRRSQMILQVGGAALLAAYLYAGLRLWATPTAELLTLVLVFSRLLPQFSQAQQQYQHWLHALAALDATRQLLADCAAAAEPPAPASTQTRTLQEGIELRAVSLHYAERPHPALDRVSAFFPANTTTAIVGHSGAGKSTLADLLTGLLEADSGEMRVDGQPIHGESRRAWQRQVAYVPQDNFLFHDSIRNNLLLARPDASEAELRLALEQAAADFVFQLPQGLDTPVGDRGQQLSGGERQRLALSRALLGRPALLILDEATSALDHASEAHIRRSLENLHGKLTLILIGHRMATLRHADFTLCVEKGTIRPLNPGEAEKRKVSDPE
ncbi:MAG: hypothetical protein RIR00_290 [Pseudomonadota bacterium]